MGYKTVHKLRIEWGDTDPARIVFYPNYFRWFDAACHQIFDEIGYNKNRLLDEGYSGMPIAEAHAEFKRPGLYSDRIEVEAEAAEVKDKSVRFAYRITRGGELLLTGYEVRILTRPHPDDPKRLQAVSLPDGLRAGLEAK
jgi:4-hydroxybenzoyl-CoA thioesterase